MPTWPRNNGLKLPNTVYIPGGQRNWIQVLCNGGTATEAAILYMIESPYGEPVVDFTQNYNTSWLCMAVLASLACCSGDTFSSELGSVVGTGDPRLITTWKRVPRGKLYCIYSLSWSVSIVTVITV